MPCTTILVGKKASNDGSTMIARNDDGRFDVKKIKVVEKDKQPRKYVSKISHVEVELPEHSLRYTTCPNVDPKYGIWAATGINEANVGMSATETITTNARVLGGDPYVRCEKKSKGKDEVKGGIGEEDLVVLVLPYIHSAREGVLRLGRLLEKYGTYEPNGIAFNDKNEVWWLETIGGHHWIAKRVKDEEYVIMPNQFGLDNFDFEDAFNDGKENLCSKDLLEFIKDNNLDLEESKEFNPRVAFGSHSDADHVYNTPRGWYMARYFNPKTYKWEGDNADFTPESDDIPWSLVPEKKITIEDVKYILSSYYQGTNYNPYLKHDYPEKGKYRPIGISRTGVMAICQIRNNVPEEISAVEWLCFGSNAFNVCIPLYTNVDKMPNYVSNVSLDVSVDNFYWASRLIGVLCDAHYSNCLIYVERYQNTVAALARQHIKEFDEKYIKSLDTNLLSKANEELCKKVKVESQNLINTLTLVCSQEMKNGYSRFDN